VSHYIVGWPLRRLDHSEAATLERSTVRDFASGAVDEENCTLLHVAFAFLHHEEEVATRMPKRPR